MSVHLSLSQTLAIVWLRDRALELRTAADRADKAYSKGAGYRAARYTAKAYRQAAALLSDAASAAESDAKTLEQT